MEFSKPLIIRWIRAGLPIVLGSMGGYAYYFFIGCVSGTCPITNNPWTSTLYGAAIGIFLIPRNSKKQKDQ